MRLSQYMTVEEVRSFELLILGYLNTHDFFWTTDIKRDLNIVRSNVSRNPKEGVMLRIFKTLKNKALLGNSDTKHSQYGVDHQYYKLTDKILTIQDIK